jgi:DNA-binding response OmpR family regulator
MKPLLFFTSIGPKGMWPLRRLQEVSHLKQGCMEIKQQSIVVVDDCPVSRHLLLSILTACGYNALECSSGTQCLDVLEREVPALILLDVDMPDINGFDLLSQIRHRFPVDSLPILLVTGKGDGKDVVRGLTTGANDYLVKPIERTAFVARVYNHINLSQIRRQKDEKRAKLLDLLQAQRAIEELTNEGVLVQDRDGAIVYCNDLMKRLAECGEVGVAKDVLMRVIEPRLYKELLAEIAQHATKVFERKMMIPVSAQNGAYEALCTVKSALHGELRLWVFQLHTREGVGEQCLASG